MRRWGRKEDAAHFANVRKVLTEGKKKKKSMDGRDCRDLNKRANKEASC